MCRLFLFTIVASATIACLPDPDFLTTTSASDFASSSTGPAPGTSAGDTTTTGPTTSTTAFTGSDSGSGTGSTDTSATSSTGDSSSTTGELLTPTCSGLLGDGKPWGRCPCDPGFECRVTAGGSVCVAACDATPCEFPGCFNGTCNVEQCVWPCDEPGDCLIEGTSCDLGASPPICTYA